MGLAGFVADEGGGVTIADSDGVGVAWAAEREANSGRIQMEELRIDESESAMPHYHLAEGGK